MFNKENLKVGQVVILDADFRNSSRVEIVAMSPNGMFSYIKDDGGAKWTVMTNRLSRILKKSE